jgi:hypothetical protein
MIALEMFCVAPVIVRFALEHEVVEAGHTFTVQVLPAGLMDVLLGTLNPANEPVPSSTCGFVGMVVFLSNGAPFQKY